jgi:hypothetical protein
MQSADGSVSQVAFSNLGLKVDERGIAFTPVIRKTLRERLIQMHTDAYDDILRARLIPLIERVYAATFNKHASRRVQWFNTSAGMADRNNERDNARIYSARGIKTREKLLAAHELRKTRPRYRRRPNA